MKPDHFEGEAVIPGNPPTQTHQARLRAFKIGAHCRIVKVKPDKATTNFQAALVQTVNDWKRSAGRPILFADQPVKVTICFHFPFPKCARVAQGVTVPKTTRPDLDNLVKNVLDALTAAQAWSDDSQVSTLVIRKLLSHNPQTTIRIEPDNE